MSAINNLCLNKLLETLPNSCYDLIGNFSMSAFGLSFLRNEIILNRRNNILEFGSGLSTIYMAAVIKKYNLRSKILSIESEQVWVDRLDDKIKSLRLNDIVSIVHTPLTPDLQMGGDNKWYDKDVINKAINKGERFDMVLIDGPPAFNPEISLSRYGALPFIEHRLTENFVVFLDDASRHGEKGVIKLWNEQFKFSFNIYGDRIAVCRRGPFINTQPSFLSKMTGM